MEDLVNKVLGNLDANDHIIEVDSVDAVVSVDGPKVERIAENLLVNALKHTPPSSHIWVRVRLENDGVLLTVEDDGAGVPDEFKPYVFDAFRRGDGASSPGSGIGLSLVRSFAELHGGRAWIEDRHGGGSSFKVFLPSDPE